MIEPRTFWEKAATTKWGSYVSGVEEEAIRTAASLAGPPDVSLDVGCEGGRWSHLLAELGWRPICTDVAQGPLRLCQRRLPFACCALVDPKAATLPCASKSIKLLLSIEVLGVVASDWFLSEAFRVLRPSGFLVATFFNRESLRGTAAVMFRNSRFYRAGSYIPWRKKVQSQGFRIVRESGYCWLPFSRQSNSALIPKLTELERRIGLRKLPGASPWVIVTATKEPSPRSDA